MPIFNSDNIVLLSMYHCWMLTLWVLTAFPVFSEYELTIANNELFKRISGIESLLWAMQCFLIWNCSKIIQIKTAVVDFDNHSRLEMMQWVKSWMSVALCCGLKQNTTWQQCFSDKI